MNRNCLAAVTLLCCCSIFANAHAADELEMLNGSKMNGKVVAETPDAITFNSGGAELKLDTALIRAVTVDGTRRELAKSEIKPAVNAAPKPEIGDRPKTLLECSPEVRRKLLTMLDDAKRDAREKIRVGTEQALVKYPKMSPEMAALMRSGPTQATWLKTIVDAAMDNAIKHTHCIEDAYFTACGDIRRMCETYTGLEGAAFIEDYISKSIDTSVGVLPPDKPADGKAPPRHLVHRIQDNSGINQLGGN